MKRILQALDTASTQPVEGANDMSKFLRIIKEADLNQVAQPAPVAAPAASTLSPEQLAYNQLKAQLDSADSLRGGGAYTDVSPEVTASTNAMRTKLAQMAAALKAKGIDAEAEYNAPDASVPAAAPVDLNQKYQSEDIGMDRLLSIINEGANPHKVSLPVQMAMNHYQAPKEHPAPRAPSLLKKYFAEAEEEIIQEEADRKERLRMYSQKIAERVLVKESIQLDEKSTSEKQARFMAAAAHDKKFANNAGIKQSVAKEFNKADTGTKQLSQAMKKKKSVEEGIFDSKPKVDWNKRAKELFAKGMTEEQVRAQLLKEGCPVNQVNVYVQAGQLEEAPIEMTGDANDPVVHGHAKANPMSLKGRIQQARNQLKELANMAESDDLVVWQKICQLSKGGMFMGLEQNIEQVRHGIEQLAAKRKQGGVASRGINKGIGETGVVDTVANKLVSAGASARKAVDTAVNSIPRPFDEKEVANDLQKQKRQS